MKLLKHFVLITLLLLVVLEAAKGKGFTSAHQHYSQHLQQSGLRRSELSTNAEACSAVAERQDCGYYGIQQEECESRHCCWLPATADHSRRSVLGRHSGEAQNLPATEHARRKAAENDIPWCFYPNAQPQHSYLVQSIQQSEAGYSMQLHRGAARTLRQFGPNLKSLQADVEFLTDAMVRITIKPPANSSDSPRYEVPQDLIPRLASPSARPASPLYSFTPPAVGDPLDLVVGRIQGQQQQHAMLDTSGFALEFGDQYLELSTSVPSDSSLYGLGETVQSGGLRLPRDGRTVTLWNADAFSGSPDHNVYGSHPFLLVLAADGTAHGLFLLNSNAMDVQLTRDKVTFRVTGGVIELYVFSGPEPEAVIRQYHSVIGRPAMPPRWALGFHQSRWGYTSLDDLKEVVARYREADIPLEVLWSDIDYMYRYQDFTFDATRFPADKFKEWVTSMRTSGLHWVPIIDPGIPLVATSDAYQRGLKEELFIKDRTGHPLLGEVWPGPVHWPDFLHPSTPAYWKDMLSAMHAQVPFSGLWLDMNEVSNFCPGDTCHMPYTISQHVVGWVKKLFSSRNCMIVCQEPRPNDPLSFPPYRINNQANHLPLGWKTIAPTAMHYGDLREYDVHNLYPLAENKVTYELLRDVLGERPFILTRATFPGVGRYAAHWSGDNHADWSNLRWSIASMINSNMWGLPLAGSDICGFQGNSDEELCARWMAAGAFYPFVRNHNELGSRPQEAYQWRASADAGRSALRLRLRLLHYLYTCFYQVHTGGGTVARPLAFEFPSDAALAPGGPAAAQVDRQWMLGQGIMVAPALDQGVQDVSVYFPPGTWYQLPGLTSSVQGPRTERIPTPLGSAPPVYLRAGTIIPVADADQDTKQLPLSTTHDAVKLPITLLVPLAPPAQQQQAAASAPSAAAADGMLYMDDGVSLEVPSNASVEARMGATSAGTAGSLHYNVTRGACAAGSATAPGTSTSWPVIQQVVILGLAAPASSSSAAAAGGSGGGSWTVRLNGTVVPPASVQYDRATGVLGVRGLQLRSCQPFILEWAWA